MSAEILKTIAGEVCNEAANELLRLKNLAKSLKDQSESLDKSISDAFRVIAIDQITHNRSKLGREVATILEKRDHIIREIENRLSYENSHVADYSNMLSKVDFKLDAEIKSIQQNLLDNAHYQQLILKLTKLIESTDSIEDNMSSVIQEMEEKRAEYQADIVFSYLLNKYYDKPAYTGRGVEKYFDKRLAAKYQYQDNYSNYSTICRVIDAANNRADETHAEIEKIKLEVARIEQESSLSGEVESLRGNRDRLHQKIQKATSARDAISDELIEFNAQSDDLFCKALDITISLITKFAIEALRKMVSCTPTEDDNRALETVLGIRNTLSSIELRIIEQESNIKVAEKSLKRAENIYQWLSEYPESTGFNDSVKIENIKSLINKAVSGGWYQGEVMESVSKLLAR